MKGKKFFVIGIISLVLVALEVACFLILVLPGINRNKMFDLLSEGKGKEASDYYDKLGPVISKDIKDEVKGFLITETNTYLDGKKKYDELISEIRAVEEIKDFKGSTLEYVKAANLPQLLDLFEKGFTDQILNKGDNLFDIWDDFDDIYNVRGVNGDTLLTNYADEESYYDYIDTALDDRLRQKYNDYKAGTIDAPTMAAYVKVAAEFFVNDEYVNSVNSEISTVIGYEAELSAIQKKMDNNDYYGAIEDAGAAIDSYSDDEYFKDYEDKFRALYDEAYSKGMEAGLNKAKAQIAAGDKKAARMTLEKLKSVFGDDVDTSEVEDMLVTDWGKAYIAFLDDLTNQLPKIMDVEPKDYPIAGKDDTTFSRTYNYDEFDFSGIKEVLLTDLDKSGVPELILICDSRSMIFTWTDNKVSYVLDIGMIAGYSDDGYIYTNAENKYEEGENESGYTGEKYDMLWKFDGKSVVCESAALKVETSKDPFFVVDSNDHDDKVEEDKYNEAVENIKSKAPNSFSGSVDFNNYKDYIESYE